MSAFRVDSTGKGKDVTFWNTSERMHGRLKVKTSAQKEAERRKEEQVKLAKYIGAREKLFSLRLSLDEEVLGILTQLLIFNCECNTYWNIRKEFVLRKVAELQGQKSEVSSGDLNELSEDQTEGSTNGLGDDTSKELKTFFNQELIFTVQCLRKNPKAYAVWLYREFIMINNPNADWTMELRLCDEFLKEDERNFHCWDYRRIVVRNVPSRDTASELAFTSAKIEENFSNFSSWHYRTKLLGGVDSSFGSGSMSENVVKEEIDLVYNALFTDPTDQSAWFYYRWLHGCADQKSRPLVVSCSVLRRFSAICVNFSSFISQEQLSGTEISICSSPVRYSCKPIMPYNHKYATKWILSIISSSIPPFGRIEVGITFPTNIDLPKVTMLLDENDKGFSVFYCDVAFQRSQSLLEKHMPETYKYDKEMMLELAKEEPNNKWILLQLLNIGRREVISNTSTEIKWNESPIVKKLIEVDPLRKRYYEDLCSELICETEVVRYTELHTKSAEHVSEMTLTSEDPPSLTLTGLSLSHVKELGCVSLMASLDLSNNSLKDVKGLAGLMNLKHLTLDGNEINDLSPLEMCYSLCSLSVVKNQIKMFQAVENLTDCHLLVDVNLEGNPLSDIDEFESKMVLLFPRLELLNGKCL